MADRRTTCCIAGGGPAGLMLGLLLARAGVPVIVMEKHADFLRDFRGDTIHPSTLELMHELGLLDAFLRRPHDEMAEVSVQVGDTLVPIADLGHLPTRCRFIALMPQWEFLDFIAEAARKYPAFTLLMETRATSLRRDAGGRVTGVEAIGPEGAFTVEAALTVAADGRHSTLREASGLEIEDLGAPMDVLWLRLSRRPTDPPQTLGRIAPGHVFITLNRGSYWQCALVIAKGGLEALKARGLPAFQAMLREVSPALADRAGEIASWDDVKLLTVTVDRLKQWHLPGLMCIGDAAHAMSPMGGVGINLAIQDAVASANLLWRQLAAGSVSQADLAKVQARRQWPTKGTQWLQVQFQNRIIAPVLQSRQAFPVPLPFRLLGWLPILRRLPARVVGLGLRPEHVQSPEAKQ